MAKRPMFFFACIVGLIVSQAMFDSAVAQTACSPDYIISLFDHISPFLVGALGASLSYVFTSRRERIKAAEDRQQRREELAIALSTELEAVGRVIASRIEQLSTLNEARQDGGHTIEKSHTSQIYKANLNALGLLGGDALKSTIEAYKVIVVMPRTVRVRRGLQGFHANTFDELSVAPRSTELQSVLENHQSMMQAIAIAIKNLKGLTAKTLTKPNASREPWLSNSTVVSQS